MAGVTRAGLDVALVVLAVLAGWQLRQFSAVGAGGSGGIDPVLVLAPALALAAGSVVVLRLLPLAAVAADWLAARGRGLLAALASWQFSRMPVRQGSAALLLVMAVATGTLALGQHQSWTRSASDQAIFAAGGDLQVDLPVALNPGAVGTVTAASGVTHAMAVDGRRDRHSGRGHCGRLRPGGSGRPAARDESARPPGSLFGSHHAVRRSAGGRAVGAASPARARPPPSSPPRSAQPRPRLRPRKAAAGWPPGSGRSS